MTINFRDFTNGGKIKTRKTWEVVCGLMLGYPKEDIDYFVLMSEDIVKGNSRRYDDFIAKSGYYKKFVKFTKLFTKLTKSDIPPGYRPSPHTLDKYGNSVKGIKKLIISINKNRIMDQDFPHRTMELTFNSKYLPLIDKWIKDN